MELRMVYFWLHALAVGGRCVCGSIFSSYIHSRIKKTSQLFFYLFQMSYSSEDLLHGWSSILDVICLFLYSSTMYITVIRLQCLTCTTPGITHLLVGHCLHGTFDLYRHLYCWSAA